MGEYTRYALVVIPVADRTPADADARALDPLDSPTTFTVPLNATGIAADPPTHYWTAFACTESTWKAIRQLRAKYPSAHVSEWARLTDTNLDPEYPRSVLDSLGLKLIDSMR